VRAGIIQSNYIPWRGYFDFIDSVDVFVILDDAAFSKGSHRNRNQLKFADGLRWLTVPVNVHLNVPIDEVLIDTRKSDWPVRHERLLHESLDAAPFFADALALWRSGVGSAETRLSPLNMRLIRILCEYLGIRTRLLDARPLGAAGTSTERVIDLLRKLDADAYLSGPSAQDYIDEDLFRKNKIRLEYKTYDYEPYPQRHGDFVGAVSVLDLIANTGPEARRYLKSLTPDQVAVA